MGLKSFLSLVAFVATGIWATFLIIDAHNPPLSISIALMLLSFYALNHYAVGDKN